MEDYTHVTEIPGNNASQEQLERLYHRYHFASTFCKEKEVLEVACGAGMGLGYLEKFAKKIVGGDIDEKILEFAHEQYKGRNKIEIIKLDAHNLPFFDKSFDVVILYEAIYYLHQPERFIDEAFRVLRDNGILLICTVNKNWSDFNPSPYSVKYFSAPELYSLLSKKFSDVKLFGAFTTFPKTSKDKVISIIKRLAISLNLIPKTMKGKEVFKRIFFGRLKPIPNEIENEMTLYISPTPISHNIPNFDFKVLYAIAKNS